MMERQRVVVVVEETETSRTALKWAIRNFIRVGDSITLLHVYPSTRCKKRQKSLRLMGFQLALSFKELCNGIAEAKVEILVKEGDLAQILVSLVNKVEASTVVVGLHDQSFLYKRTLSNFDHNVVVGDLQASKKQCGNNRKAKAKPSPSKDPQSTAAKNRRDRISKRLKILQDLMPNGTKVDSVTMLEKAISYVKFLQLQVKVLATDEFWPLQGGKAPEVAQVKEAIDAILSSHRERNSSSKK